MIYLSLIIVLGLGLRLYHFSYPYVDHHSWRQTQTAMIARNFYRNGFNILKPEIDFLGGSKVVELELQITPYLTAFLYLFFGIKDWVGRIIPIIFSLLSIVYLYNLIKLYYNSKLALFVCFVYSILPLNVFFSRVLMPESGMLFFSIAALYHYSIYLKKGGKKEFLFSIFFISLSFLSKLPNLYLLLPLLFVTWKKGFNFIFKKRIVVIFFISLLSTFLYYFYIHFTADFNIIPYTNLSNLWGNINVLLDKSFYKVLFSRLASTVFTELGLFLLILGLIYSKRNSFFVAWLFSVIIYIFVLGSGNKIHSYYQLPLIPIGSYFIGNSLFNLFKSKYKLIVWPICALLLYLSVIHLLPMYNMYAYTALEAGDKIKEIDFEDSLIITVPHRIDMLPETLYYADRKGWKIRPYELNIQSIQSHKDQGAKYLIMLHPTYLDTDLKTYLYPKIVFSSNNYIIARI